MYVKLAIRNICRSTRDYTIYFITITLTAGLMYSFLALGYSDSIISMSENMSMLTAGVLCLSVLVAFIASFVIRYVVRFMLTQRKKEFAVCQLLGMENRSIQRLFLIENSVIGLLAFLMGIIIGIGLSGILVQIVNNIFDTPHTWQLSFSVKALGLALLFFTAMYGMGILHAAKIIRQSKIVDLLYDSHKNESVKNNNVSLRICLVMLSVSVLIAGVVLLYKSIFIQTNTELIYIYSAVILLAAGIYGMYCNIPFLLLFLFKRNAKRKYNGTNLFYFGQIGRKIQSAGRLMAVIAILLTISLATLFVGLAMGASYRANMSAYYPYDAGIALNAPLAKESMEQIVKFTDERCRVQDDVVYYLYSTQGYAIEALALSDYNHLRRMLGFAMTDLLPGQFMVHCDTWNYIDRIQQALDTAPEIVLAGTTLTAAEEAIRTEPMEQYQMAGTKGYVIVVPDEVAAQLSADKIRLVMKLENGGLPELKNEIRNFLNNSEEWKTQLQEGRRLPERVTIGVTVKAWGIENSLTGFTVISFCGLYLSIVFMILSCTVLAFEQLSALDCNRYNYQVLDKMGVDKKTQNQLIKKELGSFFFIPAILPVVVTIILIIGTNNLLGKEILQKHLIPVCGFITLFLFTFIYMVYFWAASSVFKHSVLKK